MKLNNTRKICIFTASVLLLKGIGIYVSALGNLNMSEHIKNIKSGILLRSNEYYDNDIFDYDINTDNSINVLDMCRMKRSILSGDTSELLDSLAVEQLKIVLDDCIWSDKEDDVFTIPFVLENNDKGVYALEFDLSYNEECFELLDIYTGDVSGGVTVSKDKHVVFTGNDNQNLMGDKTVLYADFRVNSSTPKGEYQFAAVDITAWRRMDNGVLRKLLDEECDYLACDIFYFHHYVTTIVTTTTPEPTTIVTTTTPEPTTIVTTTTPEPTTIVTTTTTPEPTTIVTTTTTPEPTTVTTTTTPPSITTKNTTTIPKYEDGSVYFQVGQPQENHNDNVLKIPVYVQNNTIGVSAANVVLNYRNDLFDIKNVSIGDFPGQVSVSRDTGEISYTADSEVKSNGVVFYIELTPRSYISPMLLEFSLSSIEAVTILKDGSVWSIPRDKCPEKSSVAYFWTNGMQSPSITTTATTTETSMPTTVTTITTPVPTTMTTTTMPMLTTVTTTTTLVPTTVTTTTTPVTTTSTTTTTVPDVPEEKLQFLQKVNEFRISNNMAPMTANLKACAAADERARLLSISFKEDLPNGESFKSLMIDYDVRPYCVSQYINGTATTWEAVYSTYISKAKKALLDADFDRLGIGHYITDDGKHFWAVFTYG